MLGDGVQNTVQSGVGGLFVRAREDRARETLPTTALSLHQTCNYLHHVEWLRSTKNGDSQVSTVKVWRHLFIAHLQRANYTRRDHHR